VGKGFFKTRLSAFSSHCFFLNFWLYSTYLCPKASMRAAIIREFGPASVLQLVHDHPKPVRKLGEVLVEVRATSVNPVTCGQARAQCKAGQQSARLKISVALSRWTTKQGGVMYQEQGSL
jgi:hypothetical protein